jgi:hypothetical protein
MVARMVSSRRDWTFNFFSKCVCEPLYPTFPKCWYKMGWRPQTVHRKVCMQMWSDNQPRILFNISLPYVIPCPRVQIVVTKFVLLIILHCVKITMIFIWRRMDCNTKVRKIINGGNLTMSLLKFNVKWRKTLNLGELSGRFSISNVF